MSSAAKRYSAIKYTLAIIEIAYTLLLLFLFLSCGLSKSLAVSIHRVTNNNYLVRPAYLLIVFGAYSIFSFPLDFYRSFVLEHKFLLSTQSIYAWLADKIKIGLISYIIGLILLEAFYYILRYSPQMWWLIASVFWVFFSIILARLTPMIIIPLFFKYNRLSDSALRERIVNLAHKMEINILDVFEIDFSKKTLKGNAAFVGIGKTKRVILADTLKDKYSYDEIEVILAHEFAHYRLKHLVKLILVNSLAVMLSFYLIFMTSENLLSIFGFASLTDIAALPVILASLIILGASLGPLENHISRMLERNADIMALDKTGLKEAFISMMEKLSSQNLADTKPHPLIKFLFFDHPPVAERIELAKNL